jgi:hypothetical protein
MGEYVCVVFSAIKLDGIMFYFTSDATIKQLLEVDTSNIDGENVEIPLGILLVFI